MAWLYQVVILCDVWNMSEQCEVMTRYGGTSDPLWEAFVDSATILTGPQDHSCGVAAEIVLWLGWEFLQAALFLAWFPGLPRNFTNSSVVSNNPFSCKLVKVDSVVCN